MRTPAAWLRMCRKRKAGIYAYRTRRHLSPWRTEWGYVGESWNLAMRDRCHGGTCGRHSSCVEKPWYDLVVRRYAFQLPWWLGWKWVLRSMETIAIIALRPRYNVAKNRRWRRTPLVVQRLQRHARDTAAAGGSPVYRARVRAVRAWTYARAAALIMIITGIGGWMWTR